MASSNNDYVDELIAFLEEEMPSDITATNMNVSDGVVTMSCSGRSKDTLASFITTLKSQSNIYGVNVGAYSETEGASGAITISYTISFSFADFPDAIEDVVEDSDVNDKEAE